MLRFPLVLLLICFMIGLRSALTFRLQKFQSCIVKLHLKSLRK